MLHVASGLSILNLSATPIMVQASRLPVAAKTAETAAAQLNNLKTEAPLARQMNYRREDVSVTPDLPVGG